jgi:hypothetical protein
LKLRRVQLSGKENLDLRDRAGRCLIAAECRRTEVLIGRLLGKVKPGQRGDLEPSLASEGPELPKDIRHKFRLLAAHADRVEELLAAGQVSRNAILRAIRRKSAAQDASGRTISGRAGV